MMNETTAEQVEMEIDHSPKTPEPEAPKAKKAKKTKPKAKKAAKLSMKKEDVVKRKKEKAAKKVEAWPMCKRCKKVKAKTPRSKRCAPCQRIVRAKQLKDNNVTWHERIKKGKAKHHATYNGKPTEWAVTAPKKEVIPYVKSLKDEAWKEKTLKVIEKAKSKVA